MVEPEYDVCLSFASEQRSYVDEVARLLRQRNVRVFYDLYEQATMWGKDLCEHLDLVYQKRAKYCIIFASKQYAEKSWTSHERKSAQARALIENKEYILPVRFDDTDIPGVSPTVTYIDLRCTTEQQLVELFVAKLGYQDESSEVRVEPDGVECTYKDLALDVLRYYLESPLWLRVLVFSCVFAIVVIGVGPIQIATIRELKCGVTRDIVPSETFPFSLVFDRVACEQSS